jgi:hypothetical protein
MFMTIYFFVRIDMAELSRSEKDMLLIGIIATHLNAGEMTASSHKVQKERERSRIRELHYLDKPLCFYGFLYVLDLSKSTFTSLKSHFLANGLAPRKIKSGIL